VDGRVRAVDDRDGRRLDLGVHLGLDWVERGRDLAPADRVLEVAVDIDRVALNNIARVVKNKDRPEGPVGLRLAPHGEWDLVFCDRIPRASIFGRAVNFAPIGWTGNGRHSLSLPYLDRQCLSSV
jgi:hypothetical protein